MPLLPSWMAKDKRSLPSLGVETGSKHNVSLDHVGGSLQLGMECRLPGDTGRIAHLPAGLIQALDAADNDPFLYVCQAGNLGKRLVRKK